MLCSAAQHSQWRLVVLRNQLFDAHRLWTRDLNIEICYKGRERRASAAAHPISLNVLQALEIVKREDSRVEAYLGLGHQLLALPHQSANVGEHLVPG